MIEQGKQWPLIVLVVKVVRAHGLFNDSWVIKVVSAEGLFIDY